MELYVDGNFKFVNENSMFSNATQCICLIAAYLKNLDITLKVVSEKHDLDKLNVNEFTFDKQPSVGFKIPLTSFKAIFICSAKQIPDEIANSCLPAILSDGHHFVISGLCHVLRKLVKECSYNSEEKFIRLLGHKKFCLKATSEICSRTNLCEVIGPTVIDEWKYSSTVPNALQIFEKLLEEPVVIHNRDKKQRIVLKQLTKATLIDDDLTRAEPDIKVAKLNRTILNQKLKVRTNDLPGLEHIFAEGIELTLTDLALLPLVHAFFKHCLLDQDRIGSLLPNTLKWYKRITSMPNIAKAADLTCVDFLKNNENHSNFGNFELELCTEGQSEMLKLAHSNTDSPSKLKKKELEKTIRRDLPGLLSKIDESFSVFSEQFKPNKLKLDWKNFPVEVHPAEGELSTKRASRKCSQIENLVYAVKAIFRPGDVIIDFCAGGGHVGIVLAFLFPSCRIVIIENKEESLDRARRRVHQLKLNNTIIYQCNLQNYNGPVDIGIALHACGVATDMVLHKCLEAKASFVISPCCYGKISNSQNISYPQSEFFRRVDIDYDSLVLLGHAADQTSWDFDGVKPKQGKRCMELVDKDRLEHARERGYHVELLSMEPRDCTPKNNLLIGVPPSRGRLFSNYEFAS